MSAIVSLVRNQVVQLGEAKFRVTSVGPKVVHLEAVPGSRAQLGVGDREQILVAALVQAFTHVPEHMRKTPLYTAAASVIGAFMRERGITSEKEPEDANANE